MSKTTGIDSTTKRRRQRAECVEPKQWRRETLQRIETPGNSEAGSFPGPGSFKRKSGDRREAWGSRDVDEVESASASASASESGVEKRAIDSTTLSAFESSRRTRLPDRLNRRRREWIPDSHGRTWIGSNRIESVRIEKENGGARCDAMRSMMQCNAWCNAKRQFGRCNHPW